MALWNLPALNAAASALKKLPHNFARRCHDGGGDIKRLQFQRQTLEINPTHMLIAGQ